MMINAYVSERKPMSDPYLGSSNVLVLERHKVSSKDDYVTELKPKKSSDGSPTENQMETIRLASRGFKSHTID